MERITKFVFALCATIYLSYMREVSSGPGVIIPRAYTATGENCHCLVKLYSKDGSELDICPEDLVNGGKKDKNNNFVKQIDEKDERTGKLIHFTRFKSFGNCHWEIRFKKIGGPSRTIKGPEENDYRRRIKKIALIETPIRTEKNVNENSPCPGHECQNLRNHPTHDVSPGATIEPEAAPVVKSSKGGSERLRSSYSSLVPAIFILSIYIMRNNR